MKLIFKKDENANMSVFQTIGGKEVEFSYVEMIKTVIKDKALDKAAFDGDFTDAEKNSIDDMVEYINKELNAVEHNVEPKLS